MRVTDYFFCVRPSIGRLRWRSKHLGGGALFPFIPSGTPIDLLALHMAKALGSTIAFFHRTYWDLTGDKGE